ncbi:MULTISPECIES: Rieske 2Fe-2S domain-containing protein [Burkholderia]|jgi:3-ketosteroid 9alpha-monooxygenase subunit A|uniref:3-ketosteroid-9-alpha-hydroxylase n=7 Tax=Burkholderia cenocepacia TaxID=95486 RepID=A0A142PC91_9BURK|nr:MULTISPECIES: Rieske 2Fe-2S domain-containing protein [Burkholderia]AIO44206.1 3-ketosteroid-9-alpha-hydroxylase oxygenase subunit [Burkholderia cepacia]ALV59809.1 3-ketosteroid-9-alpha-hydroxylase [Burkholderia cenocepacia]AMU10247.1 3-ketosteroid-9-alpha-hydroxylase [Burkholderia cenocepacia]AMU13633.1 3-ketosteroid-9-alpha-hydroxylase [Burkholderia cenocepacia]AOK38307.1 3-ketosteroid-9-alpha-hydroxylase [Burkholderia cenocepacia]
MSARPYKIEAQPLAQRYARGWHCLGLARDYQDGKPHTLNIFGRKLAAFADSTGKVNVVDAYCPHMGADLSLGTVQGDTLVCPFHGWAWNGEGQCASIPYCKRIPPKARIGAWPTCEENNLLFVWNDPEGHAPPAEVAIPRLDVCFSDEWSGWVIDKMVIHANCRELVDNISDVAHFATVHRAPIDYFANLFEHHKATQLLVGRSEKLGGDSLTALSTYFGPAVHITQMTGQSNGQPIHSVLLNCHVPIDMNSFELRYGVIVKKVAGLSDEQNMEIANAYVKEAQRAFYEDVDIWHSKTRIDNPLLCEGDGPLYQMRDWYSQFYLDVADVRPASVARKAFEMRIREGDAPPALHHVFEPQ